MPSMSPERGRDFWRSLDELCDTPEFQEKVAKEFPNLLPEVVSPGTRRHFLKIMGASMALAGISGCTWPRWPKAKILPYSYRQEGRNPGAPLHFATSGEVAGVARPVLAKSYDGRPIKIEGNPEHPASRGAASAQTQASILELYDPDRSTGLAHRTEAGLEDSDWVHLQEELHVPLATWRREQGSRVPHPDGGLQLPPASRR